MRMNHDRVRIENKMKESKKKEYKIKRKRGEE